MRAFARHGTPPLRQRVTPRPSPGIRFEVAQRQRMRLIVRGLLACQVAYAAVGLLSHGPGSMASDRMTGTVLGVISLAFAALMFGVVGRVRSPRRLEATALGCAALAIAMAGIGQFENIAAVRAVPVYEAVAVVFVSVMMPWSVRAACAVIVYTAVVALAGIATTVADPDESMALGGALVFALIVATASSVFTWNGRVDRWTAGRRILALNAELRVSGLVDALTGLGNRRSLEQQLGRLADRDDGMVGFAIVDIDRFKGINDAYGHLAGDDVLRMVARMIQAAVRGTDRIYRYGGEEFLVVLDRPAPGSVARAAERIREAVMAPSLPNQASEHGVLTASLGTAELACPASMAQIVEAIAAADRRLYAAKVAGRNRVVWADGEPTVAETPGQAPSLAPADEDASRAREVAAALAALEQVRQVTGRAGTTA